MTTPAAILDRLQSYLSDAIRSEKLVLSRNEKDGRINSQKNERQISQALEFFSLSSEWFQSNRLSLHVAPARFWYDFAVTIGEGVFIPVNVKVSALRTSDNLSSKEGVFYALTGIHPQDVRINNWERFSIELSRCIGRNPFADYYFLIVSKEDPGDVFWTSLKKINELVPNGNNPPFQCHWGKNRLRNDRGNEEAQTYILSILRKTFSLRAEALKSFDRHLKKYLL
ncbi:MAG: hypothetical protein K8L97_27705 [Anaerolineae bacterium]|nr:hypothetical protein [Anaerolineae bacterium]